VRQQPADETWQPSYLYPDYVATRLRAPREPLIILPKTLSDTTGPAYGRGQVGELDHDLTRQHEGEPLGERIIVTGRVTDGDGRPVRDSLIEIWQANAAGRYTHLDRHPAHSTRTSLARDGASPTMMAATGSSR
jgi:protocatechuate 3,4-dioxygenase, beta subunit